MSIVVVATPVTSAAYRKALKASVVVPILDAVLASESVAFNDERTSNPNPATPATPTNAVRILKIDLVSPPNALPTELKPFLVLSTALMIILVFSAIFLTHYLKVCHPLVEVGDGHLLCVFYAHF
jgi:hypothetical protein